MNMYENCQYPLIVSYETEYQNTKEEGKESGRKDSSKDQDDDDELENPSCSSETEKKMNLIKIRITVIPTIISVKGEVHVNTPLLYVMEKNSANWL
ncbi:hypothetical protein JTB14_007413 [Gonioctena quinquepunctata]|nr:hypothetical protein JTB14_007413 [Gonioctena quinquepunctata]